ncbi:hypothetical protein P171DRAFT_426607 [Karstenula rhodostoma CBS 690.94]|uniref:Aminoglycoside phosphotransferase domain-containing protein n=1 Tax=Karstenula rhodostoma CBS 690.94 TaxID=1392251 RepID=A0A9P4PTX3_9PLEO|nr:hypothetical protein P171DRAFT_426607 [Karstenula rhodostoma CBS 690.94]
MSSEQSAHEVASSLLAERGLTLKSLDVLQSLWAGYGQICRITATLNASPNSSGATSRTTSTTTSSVSTPQEVQSYILKLITPPPTKANNEGHTRKILSYQVEQYFYTTLAPQLPPHIPVARHIASIHEPRPDGGVSMAMLISDLKQTYPVAGEKRDVLNDIQVHAALDWLSSFHGFWWPRIPTLDRSQLVRPPLQEVTTDGQDARHKSVWLNGGYTYLATRRTEYANLAADHESEWWSLTDWEKDEFSIAELVASALEPKQEGWSPIEGYTTLIHGDVKSENLFTSKSGEEVVFYDFQYTGLGLGVCDLAKLFTCSVPLEMLVDDRPVPRELAMSEGEKELLERYWVRLEKESGKDYDWGIFVNHWEMALVDWLRFQASWGFWGNTEWLEARVRFILKNETLKDAVAGNAKMAGLWGKTDLP